MYNMNDLTDFAKNAAMLNTSHFFKAMQEISNAQLTYMEKYVELQTDLSKMVTDSIINASKVSK